MADNSNIPSFDPSTFSNSPYVKRVEKPWGHELHLVPEGSSYMGKIEHVNAGSRLSLQIHDTKIETMVLINGRAKLIWDDNNGNLIETEMVPFKSYTITVGQRHRLAGITDCDIIEYSTPEAGTTWRLEDDYARPDETPEQRKKERGEE